jgi:hypothetical protein
MHRTALFTNLWAILATLSFAAQAQVPVLVKVGGNTSPPGVTVAVK